MGEAMRKIFVCGSAGFLMSNLMRYMLYRTKDFDFASVDRLESEDDHRRRVYLHKRHTFYVGDAGDPEFVGKLIHIEDPDIVVVGTGTGFPPPSHIVAVRDIVMPTAAICDLQRTKQRSIIRLVPDADVTNAGDRAVWNHVDSMVLNAGGKILRLPRCFGRRGNSSFETALRTIILGQAGSGWEPDRTRHWYAYAEDVASMLWFMMESPKAGNIIRMPAIGYASPFDMVAMSSSIHGWQAALSDGVLGKEDPTVPGWVPDSADMGEAVFKTVKWYMMNKWFFKP